MSRPQVTKRRSEKTLEFFLEVIMENLFEIYTRENPGKDRADLRNAWLHPMRVINASGDALLVKAFTNNDPITSEFLFVLSCAYWIEAGAALKQDRETAWSYAMEAMFYCGTAKSSDSFDRLLPELDKNISSQARKATGVKANNARNEPLREIGDEAVRIVRTRGENGERWLSHSAAAEAVAEEVKKFAKSKNKSLTASDGGIRTIRGYLKDAPELAVYIVPGNRRRRKHN